MRRFSTSLRPAERFSLAAERPQCSDVRRRCAACYILGMPLLLTEAIVLHAFDYLESSRIIRLLTREAGVQSTLARGARKSRARYGSALDLFAEGSAQLYVKPNRELHNLASFEINRS